MLRKHYAALSVCRLASTSGRGWAKVSGILCYACGQRLTHERMLFADKLTLDEGSE